jgi:CBS domain-containing protein
MKAGELMTRSVVGCTKTDSLKRAAQLMWEHDVGCLVVLDASGRAVGMITDRDVAMAAYAQDARLCDIRVDSAMARHVVLCSLDTEPHELEEMMRTARIRRVPVVDVHGKVVGMVSLSDIARRSQSSPAREVEGAAVAKTVSAIAGPRPASTRAPTVG